MCWPRAGLTSSSQASPASYGHSYLLEQGTHRFLLALLLQPVAFQNPGLYTDIKGYILISMDNTPLGTMLGPDTEETISRS